MTMCETEPINAILRCCHFAMCFSVINIRILFLFRFYVELYQSARIRVNG